LKTKKAFLNLIVLLVLALGLTAFTPTQAATDYNVLVWSGNGAYHVEVELFKGNATDWGYKVTNSTAMLTAGMLTN
jgi:hypothetical protein